MAQVTVMIDGKAYRMACEAGQEEHLTDLATRFDRYVGHLKSQFGEIGDLRLTVMSGIMVMDELSEPQPQDRKAGGGNSVPFSQPRRYGRTQGKIGRDGRRCHQRSGRPSERYYRKTPGAAKACGALIAGKAFQQQNSFVALWWFGWIRPISKKRSALPDRNHNPWGHTRSKGSCPWPVPWGWTHGAHLHL